MRRAPQLQMTMPFSFRRLGPGLLLLAAMLWLLRDTAVAMVTIWTRSETFAHAFLVPPIALWLVWRRRTQLSSLPQQPVPWLLVLIAAACLLWLMGELAAVASASQFALVTLIVLSVPALFGWAIARELTFPLAFLYFAVPFGEFMVPQLMSWTADFTVQALRATGIPVYREGLQFVIPSGSWSVVEACSGVRYLIASFMVGSLFAYLNYTSTKRRLIFMLAALLVPLVANWMRAYLIVMIGHLSGNELAVGVDHLIYGWVFFGIVIGTMFFIGARWAEPDATRPSRTATAGVGTPGPVWAVAAGILALLVGTQAWIWRLDHAVATGPVALVTPMAVKGWAPATAPMPWKPGFRGPIAVAEQAYVAEGQPAWLWIGYYRRQGEDRKLVSSINGIVSSDDSDWAVTQRGSRSATQDLPAFRTATIRHGGTLVGDSSLRLRVWQTYWVGGRWVASDARAKIWQALDRLLGRGDDGAAVLIAVPLTSDADGAAERFARDSLGGIAATLDSARGTR